MNAVKPVGKFEHENAFQAISEVAQRDEDDDLRIADSEDLPGHVDSDSEEDEEPEWMKRKKARPNPNKIMEDARRKAEETEERNKTILNGQPPQGHDEHSTKAHEKMRTMREAPDNDGWKVKVKKSKAKTQSGKSDINERPRRWKNIDGKDKGKPVDILTRIKDHSDIVAVSPEE